MIKLTNHESIFSDYPLVYLQAKYVNPSPNQSEHLFEPYEGTPNLLI
jgi:hypothetical protein